MDIAYGYGGEYLGGRPNDPTCYFTGQVPDGKANYLELVDYAEVARRDWYLRAIDRLIQCAEQDTTAILCSEEDPARCHREPDSRAKGKRHRRTSHRDASARVS